MGTGFQFDVYNNSQQTITVTISNPSNLNATPSLPDNPVLGPGDSLSKYNINGDPYYCEISGNVGGFTLNLSIASETPPPQGNAVLLFWSASTAFNSGTPYIATFATVHAQSAPTNTYIFPLMKLADWNSWTMATVELIEALTPVTPG